MTSDFSHYQPIRRSGISETVINSIINLIREKKLRPRDKLPSERQLCEALQVSRPSLREGMRALAYMNILDVRSGDGAYVTSLQPELLVEHLAFVLSIDDSTIIQLLQARQLVEPELAAEAAVRITDDELRRLQEHLALMKQHEQDLDLLSELDVDLHMIIADAAKNPFISRFMASLRQLGKRSRDRTIRIPAVREQSRKDHESIVAALAARDPERARQAMRAHLKTVEEGLREEVNAEDI